MPLHPAGKALAVAASGSRHHRLIAVVTAVFGAATLLSGGLVLFGPPATRSLAGDVVPFVLWFNFTAGAVYLLAALAIWHGHAAARPLAWAIALATLAIFAAFAVLALRGTPHEPRTIGALTLRSGFWLVSAIALRRR